jgi:uncharacterized PurR-regulated membrane protein YhhQ (DUF165 family)
VSTPPQPAGSEPAENVPSVLPTSVRIAAISMGVLAALLLVNAGLLWYGFGVTVDRIVEEGNGITEADARRFVLLALIPYLVIGLLLALSAWFLPRRQPWARWLGLAASFVLALLTLASVVAAGGITVSSLLLFVLSVAAVTSLVARTTGTWVPRLRTRA